jgi:hypothetical protein
MASWLSPGGPWSVRHRRKRAWVAEYAGLWLIVYRQLWDRTVGRFVRVDDQSGRKVGNVIYARGFRSGEESTLPDFALGYDNDELALADLIDETPAIAPAFLPVGWSGASPKIRALERGHDLAFTAEPSLDLAGQNEGDFILDVRIAAELNGSTATRFIFDGEDAETIAEQKLATG